jgi:hypothetical protein
MSSSHCPEETRHDKLSGILELLKSWNAWDDIAALARHQTVRNHLLTCLKSISETKKNDPNVRLSSSDARLHIATNGLPCKGTDQMTLVHALQMDANTIDALLLATLQDRDKYMQLVRRQGQEAQSLLDLLQAVRNYCCLSFYHILTLHSVWGSHWMRLSSACTQAHS